MRMSSSQAVSGIAVVLALLPSRGWSADTPKIPASDRVFVIDLAASPGKRTFDVDPGTLTVRFVNRAPGGSYQLDSRSETLLLKPFEWSGEGLAEAGPKALDLAPDPCANLKRAINDLIEHSLPERKVETAVREVEKQMEASVGCPDAVRQEGRAAVARTSDSMPFAIADGQEITILLARILGGASSDASDGKVQVPWTVELSTIGPGRWLTTFGFTFGGIKGDQDEVYFSKSNGEGAFQVAQEQERGGLAYVPTIFFTWLSRGQMRKNVAWGPAAGLGFDLSSPTPMIGIAATWRQNVSLVAGGMVRKVTRLAGSYEVGQSLDENLTSSALQQSVYRPGIFFSVAFRFGSAPFGGTGGSAKATEATKTNPAERKAPQGGEGEKKGGE